jgi:hypothetical protein
MVCRQRDNTVQTFSPQCAQQPLTERIGLRTLGRRFEDPESKMIYVLVELPGKNTVPVMDKETIGVIRWDGFAQLLQGPCGGGMCRHMTMEYAARGMFHYDKHVEQAKGGRDYHTKVTRDDRLGMIADKGAPVLRGRAFASTRGQAFGHVLSDRPWRHT